MRPEQFEGLKKLVSSASSILWVTGGESKVANLRFRTEFSFIRTVLIPWAIASTGFLPTVNLQLLISTIQAPFSHLTSLNLLQMSGRQLSQPQTEFSFIRTVLIPWAIASTGFLPTVKSPPVTHRILDGSLESMPSTELVDEGQVTYIVLEEIQNSVLVDMRPGPLLVPGFCQLSSRLQ
jgi:hypothetical protein